MDKITSEKLRLGIENHCSSKKEEAVKTLQKLITIPSEFNSVNNEGDIKTLAKFLKKALENVSIKATIHGNNDKTVVQGTFGSGKRAILLNCPLDTAPAGNLSKWKHPPYKGVIENGKIYGRGVADCKAGMISMICAVTALKKTREP